VTDPPLQVAPHVPAAQDWPLAHTFPHAPQLFRSESVAVHVPSHAVVPSLQVGLVPPAWFAVGVALQARLEAIHQATHSFRILVCGRSTWRAARDFKQLRGAAGGRRIGTRPPFSAADDRENEA
jgi:hypothetical protein